LWAEKEARLKALGVGLQFSLPPPMPGEPPWSVVKLNPSPGYTAALAAQGAAPRVAQLNFA
jgi:hypothetical protein